MRRQDQSRGCSKRRLSQALSPVPHPCELPGSLAKVFFAECRSHGLESAIPDLRDHHHRPSPIIPHSLVPVSLPVLSPHRTRPRARSTIPADDTQDISALFPTRSLRTAAQLPPRQSVHHTRRRYWRLGSEGHAARRRRSRRQRAPARGDACRAGAQAVLEAWMNCATSCRHSIACRLAFPA